MYHPLIPFERYIYKNNITISMALDEKVRRVFNII